MRYSASFLLVMLAMTLLAAQPTSKPVDSPASQPARLPLGQKYDFEYTAPQEWEGPTPFEPADRIVFLAPHKQGKILLELAPKDMEEVNTKVGKAIVDMLKGIRQKNGQKMVMEPRIEKDSRFALKIHEKYMVGDRIADEIHLYRMKNYRVVMVTVNSVVQDAGETAAIHAAGEDILWSVAPRGEKPPKPTVKKATSNPSTRPATKPAG